jgi:putative intracellular protease/amidase
MANFSEHPRTMSKTALVLATDGSEDIELVATVDILRRANVNVGL